MAMRLLKQTWLMAMLTVLVACGLTNAQTDTATAPTQVTESSTELIEATQQYKTSSSELLTIQEGAVNKATTDLAQLRALVADGLLAKTELGVTKASVPVSS